MAEHRLQPIPVMSLYKRYYIHMDNAIIYDGYADKAVPAFLQNGELMVTLSLTDKVETVTLSVTDILLNTIYGFTNCQPSRKITEYPTNASDIFPKYSTFTDNFDGTVTVNDINYYQWLNSPYYVSKDGAIFSLQTYMFARQGRNEKGYLTVSLFKQSHKLHRVVWETFKGEIPSSLEVDHIDNLRWHCSIDNLQLLTHKSNLDKVDVNIRGGKGFGRLTEDVICKIGIALLQGTSLDEISSTYNIPMHKLKEIKYQGVFNDVLKSHGIDLMPIQKESKFKKLTPETVQQIKTLSASGLSQSYISETYGYPRAMISQILNGHLDIAC